LEPRAILQTQNEREGQIVQALKQRDANRENVVLTKKKPSVDTYLSVMNAIKMGASYPSMIVLASKVPWITAMQCVKKLEHKGLVESVFDPTLDRVVSRLTKQGQDLLDEK